TENDDRWRLFLPYELVWAGGRLGRVVQQVGSWSRGLHEDWAASVARRREAVRRGEAEQTGGGVAGPIRMAEPPPRAAGQGQGGPPRAAAQVAEVESLLRKVASHERTRGGIPSLARTGEAPSRDSGRADPKASASPG